MTEAEIQETMTAISEGRYPEEPIVGIANPFRNPSGKIWNIAWGTFGSASYIESKTGAVRSNHLHRTDWHFIYVVDGVMIYYYKLESRGQKIFRRVCKTGSLIFTPPGVEHATYFPSDCRMLTLNARARDHASHEADLVRVAPLVLPSELCPAVRDGRKCVLPFEDGEKEPLRPIHSGDHLGADLVEFAF